VNSLVNDYIGEERWDAEKASELMRELAKGYRKASK
jgi:hypothetical protein